MHIPERFRHPFKHATAHEPVLTAEERGVIRDFAAGDQAMMEKALNCYLAAKERGVEADSELALQFMREVNHPVPDAIQRQSLRVAFLEQPVATDADPSAKPSSPSGKPPAP